MEYKESTAKEALIFAGEDSQLSAWRAVMADRDELVSALKNIYDPELYIDIWTLGLIYAVEIENGKVDIKMTFTSVACPAGPQLVEQVKERLLELEGVDEVNVEIVFDPPWEPSEELKGMMGIL